MKDFYRKFQLVSKFPLWPNYLRWIYGKTIQDSASLGATPIKDRKRFTCLLCGVSGEITAGEFIEFVLRINNKAKILIIDIGNEQIQSVKKLVNKKYSNADITIKQANALELNFIENRSLDWIDTDGFFSFFDGKQLLDLFREWKRILKEDGYITFRELTSQGFISDAANKIRDNVSRIYMNTKLQLHRLSELEEDFNVLNFKYSRGRSPIPLLDRYCLVRK